MSTKTSSTWWTLAASMAGALISAGEAQAQPDLFGMQPGRDDLFSEKAFDVQERTPAQSFRLMPRLGVRAQATDNVYLTASDHTSDLVTTAIAGVTAEALGPRTAGLLALDVSYDSYARAHQFNGWSYTADGKGEYDVVPRLLLLEANGSVTYGSASGFGGPALSRSGVGDRVRVTNLAFGPRLTTTIGDMLDFAAAARARWVGYHPDNETVLTQSYEDSTITEVTAGVTTGDRYASHEITVSGNYQGDDEDFRLYSGLASIYVPVSESFKVLARAGADDIHQPGVIDLQAPIWSIGFEYELNPTSYVRVEGGRRYHDNVIAAESRIDITDRFYLFGGYREQILPAQMSLSDSFLGFGNSSQALPGPLGGGSFAVNGPLFDDTSQEKSANLQAVYAWPSQAISVSANWVNRRVLVTNVSEEAVSAAVSYTRQMRPDLRGEASISFHKSLNNDQFGDNENWAGSLTLFYDLNSTVRIAGGYAFSNDDQSPTGLGGTGSVLENVVFASLIKSF